jgi:hypothetical protein
MGTTASPATVALMIFLAGTFAIVACTYIWAVTTHRPVRAHARLTGRPAAPYWYSTTGLQDERGIAPWPVPVTQRRRDSRASG